MCATHPTDILIVVFASKGLDNVWCDFLASKVRLSGDNSIDPRTVCVVIDKAAAVKLPHENHSYNYEEVVSNSRIYSLKLCGNRILLYLQLGIETTRSSLSNV